MKARFAIAAFIAAVLAAFFGFVGYNKAFASMADLTRYGSWTVWPPELLGRLVGWSEMLCAAGLLSIFSVRHRQIARVAAVVLIVNQIAAAVVHAAHGETGALPLNAVLIALLALAAALLPLLKVRQGEPS
jgi:hypothetical protein